MRIGPPVLAERLLSWMLGDGEWPESILGDLQEEHARRASRSYARASLWYWTHAVRLGARRALVRPRQPQIVLPDDSPRRPGDSLMRTLDFEFRHAWRSILKRPAMSAIVVLTLALGLGANAAVFSIVDALVLRPFTMRDSDRVTLLSYTRADDEDRQESVSLADFLDMKKQATSFEAFAAMAWWDANLVGRDQPEAVQGFRVSADFFPALGVELNSGRNFRPEEETVGQDRRVIMGYSLWQRRFAGDPSVLGSAVDIDGLQYEVIGIAPEGFAFPAGAQVWAPLAPTAQTAANRRNFGYTVIGRLAAGRTLDDAKAEMAVIGTRLEQEHPETNRGREARVYTLAHGMRDIGLGPILTMWQASALFVLLIACANVASLLLARGAERQREMAVRLAIGASRLRVMREMMIESVLLGLAAVPLALAVTWGGLKVVVAYMPAKIARFVAGWHQIDVDGRLVLFTAGMAIVSGVVFGLVPAIQASRPKLAESLKEGGRSATVGGGRLRLRRTLVVAEMALALPLLVASALSVLTVYRFLNGPQGYNPDGLLTLRAVLSPGRYTTPDTQLRFALDAVDKLSAIPGVAAAAATNNMPSAGGNSGRAIEVEGKPNPDPANPPFADYRLSTPGIFETLELPILQGRGFTDADRESTQQVAIVSQALARRSWADADPIGKRIKAGDGPWLTVVGVCGDVIHDWYGRRNYPTLYRPMRQAPTRGMALLLRTAQDPNSLAPQARAAISAIDPRQPIFDLRSMRESIQERTIGLQYVGGIMAVFGLLALVLAVVGVYGVMANMVTQRTHEIGVRMALGATASDVIRLTVRQTGLLTVIGVTIGVLLSLALNRLIEAGLLGVASSDLRILAGLAALLVCSARTAGYVPARRAAAIEPTTALRGE
jgi:putative ABC transport system permease protein